MVINLCGVQPANLLMDSEVNLYFKKKLLNTVFFLEVQNRTKLGRYLFQPYHLKNNFPIQMSAVWEKIIVEQFSCILQTFNPAVECHQIILVSPRFSQPLTKC